MKRESAEREFGKKKLGKEVKRGGKKKKAKKIPAGGEKLLTPLRKNTLQINRNYF